MRPLLDRQAGMEAVDEVEMVTKRSTLRTASAPTWCSWILMPCTGGIEATRECRTAFERCGGLRAG
jgi:hypothetical protein